nr:unnamed protein product [Callosobruchus analis]
MASNNDYCCVPQCNSWAKKDTERKLTFHRFPETNTRQVYIETEMGKRGRILKKTAVPSQKLPVSTVTSPKCAGTSSDRTDRYKRRESALCTSKNEDPQECDTETNVQAAENLVHY